MEAEATVIPEAAETLETIWSTEPDISESLVKRALATEIKVTELQIWDEDMVHIMLLRKRTQSLANREKLYNDRAAKEDMLRSRDSLMAMSKRADIALTDLAFVLCGMKYLKNTDSLPPEDRDPDESIHRRKVYLAKQAHQRREKDKISGHLVQPHKRTTDFAENRQIIPSPTKEIDISRGEKRVVRCLRTVGIPDDQYTTESQQRENRGPDSERIPIPVVKLKQPLTIFGREVHWIDTRHHMIIPEILPVEEIDKLKEQVRQCTKLYGSGAILWMKYGFAQRIVDEIPEVLHLRSVPNKVP